MCAILHNARPVFGKGYLRACYGDVRRVGVHGSGGVLGILGLHSSGGVLGILGVHSSVGVLRNLGVHSSVGCAR